LDFRPTGFDCEYELGIPVYVSLLFREEKKPQKFAVAESL
jgi:hypothetical protein